MENPEVNYDESKVPAYTLPDVLQGVTTAEGWAPRREAILELFRKHVYGRSPGRPAELRFEVLEEDAQAMDGAATMRRVAIVSRQADREHFFEVAVFLPNNAKSPAPAFVFINNKGPEHTDPLRGTRSDFWPAERLVARGFATAAFINKQLAADDKDAFRGGIIRLFEGDAENRPDDAWGALGAWAWGASRVLDYLETEPRVDAGKVAVIGHSRGGKTALWAGAQDTRFALTISNNSGCGGASLARRRFGETVGRINTKFPHWFCGNYKRFNDCETELPVDQHMLLALMAPRGLYVTSAMEDLWADPKGEFLSLVHSSPAYGLWGLPAILETERPGADQPLVRVPRAYHVRTGGHGLKGSDWEHFMDFADVLYRRG